MKSLWLQLVACFPWIWAFSRTSRGVLSLDWRKARRGQLADYTSTTTAPPSILRITGEYYRRFPKLTKSGVDVSPSNAADDDRTLLV